MIEAMVGGQGKGGLRGRMIYIPLSLVHQGDLVPNARLVLPSGVKFPSRPDV